MLREVVSDVFFDLDHTLWDFEANSKLTFQKIFDKERIDIDLERFLQYYVPINLEYWKLYREEKVSKEELRYQRLRKSLDATGVSLGDEQIHTLAIAYIEYLSSFNHMIPGTLDILKYLKPNYRLHIITNGFQEIQEKKLRNAGIRHYFQVVVNSEMAGVKKPNPRIFQLALEKANVAAQNAIMIGDNLEADILGAQRLGIHTLHLNVNGEDNHAHCKIIHHLDEIKRFL
ncbi:MAG: YjjG family noncanonical pyrimidine nucleotidase [Bacteroidota bacterium]